MSRSAPLLCVPQELIDLIYAHLRPIELLPVASTSRRLYPKAQELFYRNYVLALDMSFTEGLRDTYATTLSRLQNVPLDARRSLCHASLSFAGRSRYRCRLGRVEVVENLITRLRTDFRIQDLKTSFDMPSWRLQNTDDEFPRFERVWELFHSLLLRKDNMSVCKTLALRCGDWDSQRCWVHICESLAQLMDMHQGTPLESLEIWIPQGTLMDFRAKLGKVTDIIGAVERWNSWRNEHIPLEEPFWVLCLTRIKGLKSVKVFAYDMYSHPPMQCRPLETITQIVILEDFFQETMIARTSDVIHDPRLDFDFVTKDDSVKIKY